MTHVRTQLRERIEEVVGTLPSFAGRVATARNRVADLEKGLLARVITGGSRIERGTTDDLARSIEVSVVLLIAGGPDFEAQLDAAAAQVEAALEADGPLGNLCLDLWLEGETADLEDAGEWQTAFLSLDYVAEIMTPRGDPETHE